MIKLELDWAGDDVPDTGVVSERDDIATLVVEYDDAAGPSGWPTVVVYATPNEGREAYHATMALDAWLRDVYGCDDDDANELANLAVDC